MAHISLINFNSNSFSIAMISLPCSTRKHERGKLIGVDVHMQTKKVPTMHRLLT